MNYSRMSLARKIEFCKRHNLSTHPKEIDTSPLEYAQADIKWIKQYDRSDIPSIEWLKAPLIELGFQTLWQELERVYNE